MGLFNVPMASIIARELLEACFIIGQYRALVLRSDEWEEARKPNALKMIWLCAGGAAAFAILVIMAVAIPLAFLGRELDKTAAVWIEGVSKVVAAICILQLSLKIPKWFAVGPHCCSSTSKTIGSTDRELYFNVTWNVWREVCEIGIFLIPFFLNDDLDAFPLSAMVGVASGVGVGALVYVALRFTKQKVALAVTMAVITGWFACGLFTGSMHEFEEMLGETPDVFHMPGCSSSDSASCNFWHDKKFPFAFLRPFGYSHSPSVVQVVSFWSFAGLLTLGHAVMFKRARKANAYHSDGDIHGDGKSDNSQGSGDADSQGADSVHV